MSIISNQHFGMWSNGAVGTLPIGIVNRQSRGTAPAHPFEYTLT